MTQQYGISARLTFSNSLLGEKHLADKTCNELCVLFAENQTVRNGVIVHSDLLLDYLKANYPKLYFVSSTTKVLTDFRELLHEVNREDFLYVVPDFYCTAPDGSLGYCFSKAMTKPEYQLHVREAVYLDNMLDLF